MLPSELRIRPPPSRNQLRGTADPASAQRGRESFARRGCGDCHAPPAYTSARAVDVGVHDEAGRRAFNPPSLRGVSQGGPFFHDGRAADLADVFTRDRHQITGDLPAREWADLLAFLEDL